MNAFYKYDIIKQRAIYDFDNKRIGDDMAAKRFLITEGNKIKIRYNKQVVLFMLICASVILLFAPAIKVQADDSNDIVALAATFIGKSDLVGTNITKEDFSLLATYRDGSTKRITDFTISISVLAQGSNNIIITYGNQKIAIDVVGRTGSLNSYIMRISAFYSGISYIGSVIDVTNIVVTVYYSDNTIRQITQGFTLDRYSAIESGVNTFTVMYQGFTATLSVNGTVKAGPALNKITATYTGDGMPIGEKATKDGIQVIGYFADNTSSVLEGYTISDTIIKAGANSITINYAGKVTTVLIRGIEYCKITFDTRGGNSIEAIWVKQGQKVTLPKTPWKDSCTFAGWYTNSNYRNKFNPSLKVTNHLILYAKWDAVDPYEISDKILNLKIYGQDSLSIVGVSDSKIKWESSNSKVAKVNDNGIVSGVSNGTAKITATLQDGKEYSCVVTVGVIIRNIRPTVSKITLAKGKSYSIKTKISPSDATTKKLKYTSSNVKIAVVNSSGKVTGKKAGTCYIYVKTRDTSDITRKVKVTVK